MGAAPNTEAKPSAKKPRGIRRRATPADSSPVVMLRMEQPTVNQLAKSMGVNRQALSDIVSVEKSLENPGASGNPSQVSGEDPISSFMAQGLTIEPPFDMLSLTTLPERNSELVQTIEAMETNIEATGHRFVPRIDVQSADVDKSLSDAVKLESVKLQNFFQYCTNESFVEFRMKLRRDKETTGNSYFEVLRDSEGNISGFTHMPSYQVRLGRMEDDPVLIDRKILELQVDGSVAVKVVKQWRRFRKFVQSRFVSSGLTQSLQGSKVRWFKEFGDHRLYNSSTGKEMTPEEAQKAKPSDMANEILHMRLYSPRSPYGMPRFIGNLLSIYGDRASEEINYVTFRNNNIPSMAIMVSNGQLTQGTIDRISAFVESQIQKSDNYSKFLIIEGEPIEDDGEDGGQMKIEIKPLTDTQHKDALFQNYSKNNQDKIRRAFRLPPIFVGLCHSSDTEYLTNEGWLRFDQISGQKLATLLPSGEITYETPLSRHEFDFDGTLLHFKNRGIDALVTGNHRMRVRPCVDYGRPTPGWLAMTASEFATEQVAKIGNWGRWEVPTSADWSGNEVSSFEIPANEGVGRKCKWRPGGYVADAWDLKRKMKSWDARKPYPVSMDKWLEFLGYFVSEGSTEASRPGPVTLSQNAGPLADRMFSCLVELGLKAHKDEYVNKKTGITECVIWFSHVGLWNWLRENCGEYSYAKRLPGFVLGLSKRQIKIALDALVAGDGSTAGCVPGSFNYATTSNILNGQMHEACLKLGLTYVSHEVVQVNPKWSTSYAGHAHVDNNHSIEPERQCSRVAYKGKVSCFTVPGDVLITRRNGKVLISHNSSDYTRSTAEASRRLADEQIFSPERFIWDEMINRLFFPDMGVIYHKYKTNTPNTTDNEQLVRILQGAEKTGGMTPRIARIMLEDILGTSLPSFKPYNEGDSEDNPDAFDPDVPFSLTMARAVKNEADAAEPGQQVTALKRLQALGILEDDPDDGEVLASAKTLVALSAKVDELWQKQAVE